ncbi:MAG: hypothetical protein DWI22_02780 [Planctomycetota bacterium]|nr:MAG: hypothetical protein DWI22_02780 [Planctomycetota bacterium]
MGLTGLLLLAFCLVGFAAGMLRCRTRIAVRCARSGQQICCPTELVDLHALIRPVPSLTGPTRCAKPAWRWLSGFALNLSVRLRPFFQTALLFATLEATLITVG